MPVFTAHPTEAKRRTVLTKLNRILDILHALDFHTPTPDEAAALRETFGRRLSPFGRPTTHASASRP